MYMGIGTVGYGFAYFVPLILLQLCWASRRAQVMTIPLYACAACVSLLSAFTCDILRHRFEFIILGVCLLVVSNIILISQASISATARYSALSVTVCGPWGLSLWHLFR